MLYAILVINVVLLIIAILNFAVHAVSIKATGIDKKIREQLKLPS